jgi:RNA polymerase sigma-70 factor, ECF subfamily
VRVGQSDAEDLTAETFTRAFKGIRRFEPRGVPFRAWLFRIANNLIIGQARRARDVAPLDLVGPGQLPTSRLDPADAAVRSVEDTGLAAALARLPASHATVLDLRYLRELSVAETAQAMEITPEAVRALTYRALRSLRSELGTEESG